MSLQICLFLLILITGYSFALADDNELKQLLENQDNRFTGEMLSTVVNMNPCVSVVVSPFAVLTLLSLLTFASEGPTQDELLRATGFKNDYTTMSLFSKIVNQMKPRSEEFKMANKVYVNEKYELNENFDVISHDIFKGEVENINFSRNNQSAAEINDWVCTETNQVLKNLINPSTLSANTSVLLLNVFYFKGKWKVPFPSWNTRNEPFYVNKNYISVPMIYNTAEYKYSESEKLNAKILEMPYVGNETSMVIVLPNQIDGIQSLTDNLKDLNVLHQEMKNLTKNIIDVIIPKFAVETTVDLKEVLLQMDIYKIFSNEANLNKLLKTPQNLSVSQAIQKVFINFNEDGADAAAPNGVDVRILAARLHFKADHPFAFFLKKNGIVLLSGVYNGFVF